MGRSEQGRTPLGLFPRTGADVGDGGRGGDGGLGGTTKEHTGPHTARDGGHRSQTLIIERGRIVRKDTDLKNDVD